MRGAVKGRDEGSTRVLIDTYLGGSGSDLARDLADRFEPRLHRRDVPDRIGRVTIEGFLGAGGMGQVFRGLHESGLRVALKATRVEDERLCRALINEGEALAEVSHPHVVRLLDRGIDGDWAWMAMEHVAGKDLSSYIRARDAVEDEEFFETSSSAPAERRGAGGGRRERSTVRRERLRTYVAWFRDLARGLHALHRRELVHRDIKPANIIIDQNDVPRLIDFGLVADRLEAVPGVLEGTLPYMSPEQASAGYAGLDARSDVFSLASTFFEVVTGRRAHYAEAPADLLHAIASKQADRPSRFVAGLDESLDRIFSRALALHRGDRFDSAADLADDLDRWLSGDLLRHTRESRRVRAIKTARKHPIALSAAALALALGAVVGGAHLDERRRDAENRADLARAARRLDLAAERAFEGFEGEVRSLLERGRFDEALDLVDIPSEDSRAKHSRFGALHREVVRIAAPERSGDMLRRQALVLRGDGAAEQSFERFGAAAARHLRHSRHPDLVFQEALALYLGSGVSPAVLYLNDRSETSPLISWLRALLAVESGDAPTAREAIALAERQSRGLSAREECLRAYVYSRMFDMERLGRIPPSGGDHVAELDESLEQLDAILRRDPAHQLAATVRARILFLRGRAADAEAAWRTLLELTTDTAAKTAVRVWIVRSAVHAADDGGEWVASWPDCARHLDAIMREHPAWGEWLMRHTSSAPRWKARLRLATEVLGNPRSVEQPLTLKQLHQVVKLIHLASDDDYYVDARTIGERALAHWKAGYDRLSHAEFAKVHLYYFWALANLAEGTNATVVDDHARREFAQELYRHAKAIHLLPVKLSLGYEGSASVAKALYEIWRTEADAGQRRRWQGEFLNLTDELLSPESIARALASKHGARESIEGIETDLRRKRREVRGE